MFKNLSLKELLAAAPLEGVEIHRAVDMGDELFRGSIRSEGDYQAALAAIEVYFRDEPEPGTAEAERFDELARRLATYEDSLED